MVRAQAKQCLTVIVRQTMKGKKIVGKDGWTRKSIGTTILKLIFDQIIFLLNMVLRIIVHEKYVSDIILYL